MSIRLIMRKKIIYLFIITFITSCSTVKIGYSFGDWLIKREILRSVKLYKDQQESLEKVLDEYMIWHKKEMLPKYLSSVALVKKTIINKPLSESLVITQALLLENFFQTLTKLGHDIAPVLSTINSIQLDRSRVLLAKAFDKKIKKNKSYTNQDVASLWRDTSVDWFGELNSKQKLWLKNNINKLYSKKDSQTKLALYGKRQKDFLAIFDSEDPKKRINKQINFWNDLERGYRFFEGRPHMNVLLEEYLALIDEKQKRNIISKLSEIESKIKMLIES